MGAILNNGFNDGCSNFEKQLLPEGVSERNDRFTIKYDSVLFSPKINKALDEAINKVFNDKAVSLNEIALNVVSNSKITGFSRLCKPLVIRKVNSIVNRKIEQETKIKELLLVEAFRENPDEVTKSFVFKELGVNYCNSKRKCSSYLFSVNKVIKDCLELYVKYNNLMESRVVNEQENKKKIEILLEREDAFNYFETKLKILDKIKSILLSCLQGITDEINVDKTIASQKSVSLVSPDLRNLFGVLGWRPDRVKYKLGGGFFGNVYCIKDAINDKKIVVKLIKKEIHYEEINCPKEGFERGEMVIVDLPEHENIASCNGFIFRDTVNSIYRYVDKQQFVKSPNVNQEKVCGISSDFIPDSQDLIDFLNNPNNQISIDDVKNIGMQIGKGLVAMHNSGIIHRDIKPENILINTKTKQVKIIDFGLSRNVGNLPRKRSNTKVGTPFYLAPELRDGLGGDFKVDSWSFGVVLFSLAFGMPLWESKSLVGLKNEIDDFLNNSADLKAYSSLHFPEILNTSNGQNNELWDVLNNLICSENKRMSVEEVLNLPFFKK